MSWAKPATSWRLHITRGTQSHADTPTNTSQLSQVRVVVLLFLHVFEFLRSTVVVYKSKVWTFQMRQKEKLEVCRPSPPKSTQNYTCTFCLQQRIQSLQACVLTKLLLTRTPR